MVQVQISMQMLIIVILTELYYNYFMYVISMTSSIVNTCVTRMSFIVFVNVVYSMSSAEAHAWSRIHFCIISRSPNMPTSANSTNAILSQSIWKLNIFYVSIANQV